MNEASGEIAFIYDESVSGASVYNLYRDYSPEIGRYIESDPVGLTGGANTYAYVSADPLRYSDRTGLITECELFALQLIINRAGVGPHVGAGGIITDPTMTDTPGKNNFGGPIVLNTNPNDANGYAGSVTANGKSFALVITGVHENYHQSQNFAAHTWNSLVEALTGGNAGQAAWVANDIPLKYPNIASDFEKLVEQCRKCKDDPVIR